MVESQPTGWKEVFTESTYFPNWSGQTESERAGRDGPKDLDPLTNGLPYFNLPSSSQIQDRNTETFTNTSSNTNTIYMAK